jgi:hypothetical protein
MTTNATTTAKLADGPPFTFRYLADYTVRVGSEVVSGRLERRLANGDLLFLVDSSGTTKRVRPSKVYAVAAREDIDAGPVIPDFLDGEDGDAYLRRIERTMGSSYARWVSTPTGQAALEAANAKRPTRVLPTDAAPKTKAGRKTAVASAPATEPAGKGPRPYAERNQVWKCGTCKKRTRRPSCTGPADAPHTEVAAPAGKRRESRETGR